MIKVNLQGHSEICTYWDDEKCKWCTEISDENGVQFTLYSDADPIFKFEGQKLDTVK